ncbi:MAG: Gx transporter family protein [Caldisericia bacterium]
MEYQNKIRNLIILSVLLASGVALNLIEPPFLYFIAPGVKIGIANIATLFSLYYFGPLYSLLLGFLRPIVVSLIKGNLLTLEFILSFSGSIISTIFMIIFYKIGKKTISIIGVSIIGGIIHNFTQFMVVYIITNNLYLFFYLPVLIVFGGLSGFVIGLICNLLLKRIKEYENERRKSPW